MGMASVDEDDADRAPGSAVRSRASGRTFAYQPALDGLRGLAVIAVLLFHGQVRWMRGGYVGVSVFFTLSGFLITSLLIGEHGRTGRVDAPAFYARRARRLLPASAVCLLAVSAVAALGGFDGVVHLRRDLVAAALQVFNWAKLAGGSSYADLFSQANGRVNPLDHYWSLAIEEQFYWLWPVTFAGLAALARKRRASIVAVVAVPTVLFVVAAPVIARVWGPDAAYWATPARVGEILTGAVAAALVADGRVPRWARSVAPLCLAAIALACWRFPSGSGPAYQGWLPLLSIVTAVLLLGLQSDGPLRGLLSWRPLVLAGVVSYGLYLYHWPLFALLDEGRVGFGGAGLLAVRLGATVVAATASYVVLERPVRRARWRPIQTLVPALGLSGALVLVAVLLPSTAGPALATGDANPEAAITADPVGPLRLAGGRAAVPPDDAPPPAVLAAPIPSRPVRILVLGDSTAEATGNGLSEWAAGHPKLAQVTVAAAPGCGLVLDGVRVFPEGEVTIPPSCRGYATDEIPAKVTDLRPDVVLLMTSWETANRRWPGGPVEGPLDADYRRRIGRDVGAVTRAAVGAGAPRVVLVREPLANPYWNPVHSPQEEPARHQVLHDAMARLARADPAHVRLADVTGWLDAVGLATDHATRPDGVHWSPPAALRLATDYLGPLLVNQALT